MGRIINDDELYNQITKEMLEWPDYKKRAYNEQFATSKYVKKLPVKNNKRLTFRVGFETYYTGDNGKSSILCGEMTVPQIRECMEKLAAYEDTEENKSLLKLPCRIGDPVWFITKIFDVNSEDTIESIDKYTVTEIRGNKYNPVWYLASNIKGDIRDFHPSSIGRYVFLNVIDAANKLEERNE